MTVPSEPSHETGDTTPRPPGCFRHPDRETWLRCTRCERPACPACLREAAVGSQCVECVSAGQRDVRRPVTVAGARVATKPVVVPVLLAINVLVFVATAILARDPMNNANSELFAQWSLWPPQVAAGEWWRLLTAGFLHIGPFHLLVNMYALWILGRDLESLLGRLRFVAVYLVSLFGGSIAVFLLGSMQTSVAGASGAVFGLMGGVAVAALRLKVNPRQALLLIGINLVISVLIPGISLLGHLGGLLVGSLATAGMVFAPRERRTAVQVGTIVGILVLLVVAFLLRDAQLGPWGCAADGTWCVPLTL
ncbi:rhomboid family intramembrane serine protease [Actinoalloteichus caeruleus]|uniref:rhomboid family intramembrane serine protease n=1 Tax=Actinoalloteichus cyanogriseus TaxID=2893586 RepID=UPI003AB10076